MLDRRITPDQAEQRLDRYLRRLLPELSLTQIYRLCRKGQVRLNGKRVNPGEQLHAGDEVRVRLGKSGGDKPAGARATREPRFRGQAPPVLYEDEELLVLDKPPGLAVQPGTGHTDDSVCDWLAVRHRSGDAEAYVPAPIHRLDRWASGVLVVAKQRRSAKRLTEALQQGGIGKTYLVLAVGVLTEAEGVIDAPLANKKDGAAAEAEQAAATRFRVLGRHPVATLLECQLEHGRNHQIRRHLAAIGHPVAGDRRHGDVEANAELQGRFDLRRLFLHAASVTVPTSGGEPRLVRAALPADLTRTLQALRIRI